MHRNTHPLDNRVQSTLIKDNSLGRHGVLHIHLTLLDPSKHIKLMYAYLEHLMVTMVTLQVKNSIKTPNDAKSHSRSLACLVKGPDTQVQYYLVISELDEVIIDNGARILLPSLLFLHMQEDCHAIRQKPKLCMDIIIIMRGVHL